MRSSSVRLITRGAIRPLIAASLTMCVNCAGEAPQSTSKAADPIACAGQPAEASGDAARAAAEVRRVAEAGPLFTQLATVAAPSSCQMTVDAGRIAVEYSFGTAGTLRVTSDPRIEYNDQEARLTSPIAMERAKEVLQQAERASFSDGCGMNWTQPDPSGQADGATSRETVFRGDTCNCQARASRAPDGRVIALAFRSAC